jgi:hypothetical protein
MWSAFIGGFVKQQQKFLQKRETRRSLPANTGNRSFVMSHDETKKETLPTPTTDDGFNDTPDGDRIIQGTIVKCVDGHWMDRDGLTFPPDAHMLALATATALQRWENQMPVETIIKRPNQAFPNADDLNAAIPLDKWEDGIDGEPREPWQLQYIVYLLDPNDASMFTFINSTVGAEIAVERLKNKVKWMRALRGENVVPLVKLDSRPMKTKFGQKMRPEFTVIEWRDLSGGRTLVPPQSPLQLKQGDPIERHERAAEEIEQVPTPAIRKYVEIKPGKPVEPVSTAQALDDEISF